MSELADESRRPRPRIETLANLIFGFLEKMGYAEIPDVFAGLVPMV